MTVRLVELFSGIGSQRMALMLEGIPFESVGIAEINKHALASYEAIYGDCPNLGDISKVESLPDCDLVTYSFPCQDLSLAGKRKGMVEGSGTRSALVWEVTRVLEATERKPEWLLMENVPMVLSDKNRPEFQKLVDRLARMGYSSKYGLLDSSDFGSAQKRVRAFMVSRLGAPAPDLPKGEGYQFRCIRDIMEPEVTERFIKRIPLDRIKWRSDPSKPSPPRSKGSDRPTLDVVGEDFSIKAAWKPHRLLLKSDGLCRTVICNTNSFQRSIKVVADWNRPGVFDQCNRIYANGGLSPVVISQTNTGNRSIKVMAEDTKYDFNVYRNIYDPDGCAPTYYPGHSNRIQVVADWDREKYLDSQNRLYSPDCLSPSLITHGGSDHHVKVAMEVKPQMEVLADFDGKEWEMWRRLYSDRGLSPTLPQRLAASSCAIKVVPSERPQMEVLADFDGKEWKMWRRIFGDCGLSPTLPQRLNAEQTSIKVLPSGKPGIESFGCFDEEGFLDQSIVPSRTFLNRRVYDACGISPCVVASSQGRIKVADCICAIEDQFVLENVSGTMPGGEIRPIDLDGPNGAVRVLAEDGSRAYASSAKILSRYSLCPTLRAQAHGLQNQPKVADSIDPGEGGNCPLLVPGRASGAGAPGPDSTTSVQGGELIVRVLTPRECWRLMGFPDWAYDRASAVCSETQLYNQAGNSIVTEVLRAIFRTMITGKGRRQASLNDFLGSDQHEE